MSSFSVTQGTFSLLGTSSKGQLLQGPKMADSSNTGLLPPPSDPEGGPRTTQLWCSAFIRWPCPVFMSGRVLIGSGLYPNKALWPMGLPWSVLPNQISSLNRVGVGGWASTPTAKLFHNENELGKVTGETDASSVWKSTTSKDLKCDFSVGGVYYYIT